MSQLRMEGRPLLIGKREPQKPWWQSQSIAVVRSNSGTERAVAALCLSGFELPAAAALT